MQHPTRRRDPWPIVAVAAAATFAILAVLVLSLGQLPFDESVTLAVQGLGIPAATWVDITTLGSGMVLIPVGVAVGLAALVSGRLRLVAILAVVLIGATLFTELTKVVFARPRPPWEHLVATQGLSFPSGHSLNSTSTYGLLAVVAWRTSRLPRLLRGLAAAAGLVLPFLVGVSRVALGVHYPSDVLGGWSGGLAFVAAGAVLITALAAMERGPLRGPGRP